MFKTIKSLNLSISKKFLIIASFTYMYIPIFLFLLTWTKLYIGLPIIILGLYISWSFLKSCSNDLSVYEQGGKFIAANSLHNL